MTVDPNIARRMRTAQDEEALTRSAGQITDPYEDDEGIQPEMFFRSIAWSLAIGAFLIALAVWRVIES